MMGPTGSSTRASDQDSASASTQRTLSRAGGDARDTKGWRRLGWAGWLRKSRRKADEAAAREMASQTFGEFWSFTWNSGHVVHKMQIRPQGNNRQRSFILVQ